MHGGNHFLHQLGACGRRDLFKIPSRIVFHQITAHHRPVNRVKNGQYLSYAQPPRLPMRHPGRERRVEHVYIDGDVNRMSKDVSLPGHPPAHVHHLHSEAVRLFALMPRHGPNSHLYQLIAQPLLHDPRERTGVRESVALEDIVQVGVRIKVEQSQLGVMLPDRTHNRIGDGVIATQHQRSRSTFEHAVHRPFDGGARRVA